MGRTLLIAHAAMLLPTWRSCVALVFVCHINVILIAHVVAQATHIPAAVSTLCAATHAAQNGTGAQLWFAHPRKSGGSGLRGVLAASARYASMKATIPCHTHACGVLEDSLAGLRASELAATSVLATHASWDTVKAAMPHGTMPQCFTIVRQPLDRVISCYYY